MKKDTVKKNETGWVVKVLLYIFIFIVLSMTAACGGVTRKSEMAINEPSNNNLADKGIISAYELHKILTDHFGFVSIKLSDVQYTLPDNAKLAQLKRSTYCGETAPGKEKDGWGCDDYAIAAMVQMRNYAFGTMYVAVSSGTIRVMNVLVNNDKKVIYWEPQACQYYQGQFDKPEFILF